MKQKNYALPLALIFSLFLPVGNQQQPAAYHDQTIDENLRTKYVRSLFHRNGLLAGLLYLPDTDCHVHEAVQLQRPASSSDCCWPLSEDYCFPGSHAEKNIGRT